MPYLLEICACSGAGSSSIPRRSPRLQEAETYSCSHRERDRTPSRTLQLNLFGRRACIGEANVNMSVNQAASGSSAGTEYPLPPLASMERERLKRRKPPVGEQRERGRAKIGRETRVTVSQWLKQFQGQGLKESAGKIFCTACKEEQPDQMESIRGHVASQKHIARLQKLESSSKAASIWREDLAEMFDNHPDLKGSKLDAQKHRFRYHVMETFLISGTPLVRLPFFKPILERSGFTVGDRSDLSATYIPLIESEEFKRVKAEVKDEFIGIAFDGTSRLGEAVNLTGRYCTCDFNIEYRLLRFITSKLHLKAREFAPMITRIMCSELAVDPSQVVCLSRDSVLVNGATCRILQEGLFNCAENQLCIAHTLNNVGERINLPTLKEFMSPWLDLVGESDPHKGAQSLWKQAVHPHSVPGFSAVRWYATAEIQFVLAENFDKLPAFLNDLNAKKYGDATRSKLCQILADKR